MIDERSDNFEKAKKYIYQLLKYRDRSEKELRDRLKRKKFSSKTIDKVVNYCQEFNLLDDTSFTRSWVESKFDQGFGVLRIKSDLAKKGISSDLVEKVYNDITSKDVEREKIRVLIDKKIKLSKKEKDIFKLKKKIFAYVCRRGFSWDLVSDEINNMNL